MNGHSRIEQAYRACLQQSVIDTTNLIMCATFQALNDEFGFGRKRLETLEKRVQDKVECVQQGYATIEDLVQWKIDCLGG